MLLAFDHVRRFVRGHANAVADTVDEVLAVASFGDDLAAGAIDLLTSNAGAHGLEGGLLGVLDDFVHLALFVRRRPIPKPSHQSRNRRS